MISVTHLSRRFGSLHAVQDLSFEIARGEIVGFLGPNGAGKTTTLRILSGYLPASEGSARVAGFDVLTHSLEVRKRIGYLPESVPLYREHRVQEMLEFQARLHEVPRADRARRIDAVLERVGLTDRRRDLIGNLSRGLRQRAGLAVALLPDPEVLILDEPTSGLDPIQRIEVRNLIRELAEKRTVLLSSHILPEIEATCPRVIILHEGKLAADGTPDALVRKLGGASHVRLEAALGGDLEAALRILRAIPGVLAVHDRGRLGVHHQFDLVSDADLREDIGAIAMTRRWALRELSWRRPTLEQIFTRIALGHGSLDAPSPAAGGATLESASAHEASVPVHLSLDRVAPRAGSEVLLSLATTPAPASPPAAAARSVYNLNPFERGANRDLSRPKSVEPKATPAPASAAAACAAADADSQVIPKAGDSAAAKAAQDSSSASATETGESPRPRA